MKPQILCVVIACLFVNVVCSSTASSDEEFVKFLKARERSIKSYKLTADYIDLKFDESHLASITAILNDAETDELPGAIIQYIETKVTREPLEWIHASSLGRGNRFKIVLARGKEEGTQLVYDGERYCAYRPTTSQKQMDIFPEVRNDDRPDLEYFYVTYKKLLGEELVQLVDGQDSVGLEYAITPQKRALCRFLPSGSMQHLTVTRGERRWGEIWFYGHKDKDGYTYPAARCSIREFGQRYGLTISIIRDLDINCPIADEELALRDVPLWAVVVDHHFDPPRARRYIDSPDTMLEKAIRSRAFTENVSQADEIRRAREPVLAYEQIDPESHHEPAKHHMAGHREVRAGASVLYLLALGALGILITVGVLRFGRGITCR